MKIQDNNTEVIGDLTVAKEVAMGIHATASAHIMKLLTNLYTNPAAAVVREYTANAWDSHFKAGQKRPVELTLPSRLQPSFVVEDFGVGMDRAELELYGQYGFSSKSGENDENGGFGLGSKVGLAVSTQYTVRSVKDGYEDVVIIGLNESGNPVLKFLYASPKKVAQDNGVKIIIPVSNPDDFTSIDTNDFFVGWEPGTIKVNGILNTLSVHDETRFTSIDGFGYKASPSMGRPYHRPAYESYHRGFALVGPVRYDINWNEVPVMNDKLAGSYFNNLVVQIPIGAVDLVPSRETLRYTNRTKDALNNVVKELTDRAKATYVKQINEAKTFREALKIRKTAFDQGFEGEYEYKGVSMTPKQYDRTKFQTQITWGSVFPFTAANGKDTYRTDRMAGDLNASGWSGMIDRAIGFTEPVLVTGVPDDITRKPRGGGLVHDSAKISANLARALAPTSLVTATEPQKMDFAFVSVPDADLDAATRGAFTLVMDWQDAWNRADAKRKEIASAARSGASRVKRTAGDAAVKVTKVSGNGGGYDVEKTLGELDTSGKYILLGHDSRGRRIHRAITTRVGFNEDRKMSTAAHRLAGAGYTFITHNKNWKTSDYAATVTLIDFNEAFKEVVKKEYDTFSTTDLAAVHSYENSAYELGWARQMPKEKVADIGRKETREWVSMLGSIRELANRVSTFKALYDSAQSLGIDLTGINVTGTTTGEDFGARYALLANLYVSHRTDWDLITEYVNFIDSK